MKKYLWRMICAALCAALLAGTLGTAAAAGKKSGGSIEASGIEEALADWYYAVDTVPEGLLNQKEQSVYLYSSSGSGSQSEDPTICSAEFVSGDEALKDAIQIRTGDGRTTITVDNSCLKAPGEAVFRIHLESDSYIWEKKYTLRVLDYNEYPMFEITDEHPVIEAELGDSWRDDALFALVGKANADDIRNKLKIKPWNYGAWYVYPYLFEIKYPEEAERSGALSHDYIPYPFVTLYNTTVNAYGAYDVDVGYAEGNVKLSRPVRISALGLVLNASGETLPGSTVKMSVNGSTEGRTFTWSVEGEGAKIDEKTGELTIDANAPIGAAFTVTAASEEGDAVSAAVFVNDGVLSGVDFTQASGEGFTVGIPEGNHWRSEAYVEKSAGELFRDEYTNGDAYYVLDGRFYLMEDLIEAGYAEDPEKAREIFPKFLSTASDPNAKNYEEEIIDIDGHPAHLSAYEYYNNGAFYAHIGMIWYPRNNRMLRYRVFSVPQGGGAEETKKVTMTDLKLLASKILYNENKAPLSAKNAAITVSAKDDPAAVTAGKNLQFTAAFADPDQINKKARNDGIAWSVARAGTGGEVPAATISDRGQLKIDKSLDETVQLEVKATSKIFGTEGVYQVTAVPVVNALTVEPAELFFYTGTDTPQTVKATLDPPVGFQGLSWAVNKDGVVEITDNGDGTASVRPLAAGKVNIDVRESGGKKAKLTATVADPVTALTLAAKGAAKPGGSVTVTAATEPRSPANKALEWSLDVGEDIASINERGQVKISKEAPAGTKITVTCKALGAPEPVTATLELEVAE